MGQKTTAVFMIILMLGIGGLGGFLFAQTQPIKPPSEHQAIVDSIIIQDIEFNVYLHPKCVDAGIRTWAEHAIIELEAFQEGRPYQQTTWLWQRYGDTELAMSIWGPGEDKASYGLEFGRLGANPFRVQVMGEEAFIIPWAAGIPTGSGWASEGYYTMTVEVR